MHLYFISDRCNFFIGSDCQTSYLNETSISINSLYKRIYQHRDLEALYCRDREFGISAYVTANFPGKYAGDRRMDLKKLNFAICDLEASYACRLMNYITEKQNIPFEILVFSGIESLREFTRENKVELLLISSRMMCEEINKMDINRIVMLSEGEVAPQYMDYPTVYKYQASNNLVAEVMNFYASESNGQAAYFMKRNAQIIGVYSPVKRCGKTCFALTLGQILAKKQSVLYLNLEECAGLSILTGQNYGADITDVMYFVRQNKGNVIFKVQAIVQHLGNLAYVPPAYSAGDLREVSQEEWLSLLEAVTSLGGYETVILDLEGTAEEQIPLLSACTRIFSPVCEGIMAKAKVAQYEKLLKEMECDDILNETVYLQLPFAEPTALGEYALEQLVNSEMGNYVRTLLSSEEWKK